MQFFGDRRVPTMVKVKQSNYCDSESSMRDQSIDSLSITLEIVSKNS